MQTTYLAYSVVLAALAVGCAGAPSSPPPSQAPRATTDSPTPAIFFPQPIDDEWSKWIVGEWEGAGTSNAGKGHGTGRFELALGGQFLICRGQAEITGLDPDYLKRHMHATDTEIERFARSGYQHLEIYTIDQKTGEVIAYLFDSLRCIATGRGRREGYTETLNWQWQTGHKSTRITQRVSADKMLVVERTPNPDGSVMEDKGELTRAKR